MTLRAEKEVAPYSYGSESDGLALVAQGNTKMLSTSSQLITSLNVSDLDGTNGFTISSMEFYALLGLDASSAGDINGDGFDDLILGAPSNFYAKLITLEPVEGKAYVVFGQAAGFPANLDVSILNGNNGFVISGMNPGFYSDLPVSSAGDINGDGFDDLLFASPYFQDPSYVVFGQTEGFPANLNVSSLDGNNGFAINGVNTQFDSVSSAGDINGDGFDDIIIGSHFSSPSGKGYVVFGSAEGFSAALDLSSLNGSNGFVINGINTGNFSRGSVSLAGDVNGDRLDDILISTGGNNYVVFGKTGGFSASLDLSSLNGNNGFVINSSGTSSLAGDVNGDGINDIIIGNPNADPNGVTNAGSSYVIFGQAGGFGATLDPSTLNGSNGFVINGINANDRSGKSVSSAGDVNGDGFDDLTIV
ncbi:MAG TPA: FG-GAP and VCBS repeat-containing protein, partial [Allocoleopsis sp.]